MANIDLNKLFTKKFATTSLVDSNINLNKPVKNDVLYSDVKLDLVPEKFYGESINSQKTHNDLATIVNEESIINSLKNIMSTRFNSRLLNPEMNFDLRSYLFENLSESKAYFIGYDISLYLPVYEPRIIVDSINVTANYAEDTYIIDLSIFVPELSKNIKLSSILNSDGISFS